MSGAEICALIAAELREEELLANDVAEFLADGGDHGIEFYALPGLPRRFLATQTPARALREAAAKRRIIDLYGALAASAQAQRETSGDAGGEMNGAMRVLDEVLKALAAVYTER